MNRTESSPNWDLQFAANDARRLNEVLVRQLKIAGKYADVIGIRLVSDAADLRQSGESSATKFHMVLADIGKDQPWDRVTEELRKRSLSSDELSVWLRDVDVGELAMVVDTCHSEATVAYEGFKPGPMGSRGLGQLAYDKGMRILAASKSD